MIGFMKIYDPCTIMLKKLLLKHNKIKKLSIFLMLEKLLSRNLKVKISLKIQIK